MTNVLRSKMTNSASYERNSVESAEREEKVIEKEMNKGISKTVVSKKQ